MRIKYYTKIKIMNQIRIRLRLTSKKRACAQFDKYVYYKKRENVKSNTINWVCSVEKCTSSITTSKSDQLVRKVNGRAIKLFASRRVMLASVRQSHRHRMSDEASSGSPPTEEKEDHKREDVNFEEEERLDDTDNEVANELAQEQQDRVRVDVLDVQNTHQESTNNAIDDNLDDLQHPPSS